MIPFRRAILTACCLSAVAFAIASVPRRVAAFQSAADATALGLPPGDLTAQQGEHPLEPVIRWGKAAAEKLGQLEGYTCTLVKRERLEGRLGQQKGYDLKVRHRPFSAYMGMPRRSGRRSEEAIFVEGRNDGMLWAHSERYRHLGTVSIYPDGRRALKEARYPITDIGIVRLVERLVEVAEKDTRYDECEVKVFEGAKLQNRPCWCITVTHPVRRDHFLFHLARVWVDETLEVPIRYESYRWPRETGAKPVLMEEYTYLNLRFDRPPRDRDFDIRNPGYDFPQKSGDRAEPFASTPTRALAPRVVRRTPLADAPLAKAPRVVGQPSDARPAAVESPRVARQPLPPREELPAPDVGPEESPPPTNGVRETQRPIIEPHPLDAVLATAKSSLARLEEVRDYSCIFAKRERVDGKLGGRDFLALKVRHEPFSVYIFSMGPVRDEGEEAIYVDGDRGGLVLAHGTGIRGRVAGTVRLDPNHRLLMKGNRFPLTELGFQNLLSRLIAQFESELESDDCKVAIYPNRRINDRTCTCVQIVYEHSRPERRYSLQRLYFDDEREIPIRFEGYGWPATVGAAAPLLEEYTYLDVRLDRGLSDADFDTRNPDYKFPPASGDKDEPPPAAVDTAASGAPQVSMASD